MAKMEDWNMVDHNGHRQGVSGKPVPLVVITKVTCDGSLFATSAGVFCRYFLARNVTFWTLFRRIFVRLEVAWFCRLSHMVTKLHSWWGIDTYIYIIFVSKGKCHCSSLDCFLVLHMFLQLSFAWYEFSMWAQGAAWPLHTSCGS